MGGDAVRVAGPADRDAVVDRLSAAFAADPVVGWLLGPRRATVRHRRRFFAALITPATLAGGGCDLSDDGAAVWYRPGGYPAADHPSGRELFTLVAAFGARTLVAARAEAVMRAHHPAAPHWYLQFIGVVPDRVGRGAGSRLLDHRLQQIDADGGAAYLESSSAANLPLYRRYGFEVTDEIRLAADAPVEWLMWRPPQT